MKNLVVLALVVLSLSGCATLGQPPVSGFGSNMPNGVVLERVNYADSSVDPYTGLGDLGYDRVVATTGLGAQDTNLLYAAYSYRLTDMPEEENGLDQWWQIARLICVSTDAKGNVTPHWLLVSSTTRYVRTSSGAFYVFTTGTKGRAAPIADAILARIGTEIDPKTMDLGDDPGQKLFKLAVFDDGDRVIVKSQDLYDQHTVCAAVRTAEEATRFLAANLLPPPQPK